jgi:hypothetical protein
MKMSQHFVALYVKTHHKSVYASSSIVVAFIRNEKQIALTDAENI